MTGITLEKGGNHTGTNQFNYRTIEVKRSLIALKGSWERMGGRERKRERGGVRERGRERERERKSEREKWRRH